MARVTAEDCMDRIPNQFDLVMLAAQRARELESGSGPTVNRGNDKNSVVALREIADGTISSDDLMVSMVESSRRMAESANPNEEAAYELAIAAESRSSEERLPSPGDISIGGFEDVSSEELEEEDSLEKALAFNVNDETKMISGDDSNT